jgi:hypothetical protein
MRQRGTTRKNRKVRLAQELHDTVITILYKRDLMRLGLWLRGPTPGRAVTRTKATALEEHVRRP